MNIQTKVSKDTDYQLFEGKTERLISLVKQAGGSEYLSGPAAKSYLDEELFRQENIKVTWMDYSHYQAYDQIYPPFVARVSILDLILHQGKHHYIFFRN